jgi:surface carbohydrate biosynthesis protein (TIGR04326 family)
MVCNNVTAAAAFAATSVPEHVIVDCEALRYFHLSDMGRVESFDASSGPLRVLILGEMRHGPTTRTLGLLVDAVDRGGLVAEFTVKSHPSSPIRVDDYPSLNLLTTAAPLSAIVGDFDVAYSCNGTSAGVDVYLAGLPVIIRLDDKDLNLNDLRGWPDVRFVGDSTDLVDALQAVADGRVGSPAPMEFFTLDPGLPRWRRLLAADRAC